MSIYEVRAIAVKAISQPKSILLYQLEDFFVGYRILVADNYEFLFVFNQLGQVFRGGPHSLDHETQKLS
jgi:hypothetical protein